VQIKRCRRKYQPRARQRTKKSWMEDQHDDDEGLKLNQMPPELLRCIFKYLVPVLKTKRDEEALAKSSERNNGRQKGKRNRRKKTQRLNRSTSLSLISPSMSTSLLVLPSQKKARERKKDDTWWCEWRNLRLVCKAWHEIVSDPMITMHLERRQHVFLAKVAEQAERYSGTRPPSIFAICINYLPCRNGGKYALCCSLES